MLCRLECGLQSRMFANDWGMLHGHLFQRVWKFLSTFQTNYIGLGGKFPLSSGSLPFDGRKRKCGPAVLAREQEIE